MVKITVFSVLIDIVFSSGLAFFAFYLLGGNEKEYLAIVIMLTSYNLMASTIKALQKYGKEINEKNGQS